MSVKHGAQTRRKVFMTPAFRDTHKEAAAIFEATVCNTFKLLADIDTFAVAKDQAAKSKVSASVIALIAEDERAAFANIPHVFTLCEVVDVYSRWI